MKIKHPVFKSRSKGGAQWYAVVDGDFYYWSNYQGRWVWSSNYPGHNEKELQVAMDEGRVYMVQLKGGLSSWLK